MNTCETEMEDIIGEVDLRLYTSIDQSDGNLLSKILEYEDKSFSKKYFRLGFGYTKKTDDWKVVLSLRFTAQMRSKKLSSIY